MHDDYHAPAECLDNPTTGPDAIYSVWMQAGEQLQFENDYSIYPRSESRPTVQDSVACYLLDDLRGGAGSCVDALRHHRPHVLHLHGHGDWLPPSSDRFHRPSAMGKSVTTE